MTPADLFTWRNRLGLSQSEAAARLNTPTGTYQNWEQGRRPIPGVVSVATRLLDAPRTA